MNEQLWLIYLLSISENLADTLHLAGNWAFAFGAAVYIFTHIRHWAALGSAHYTDEAGMEKIRQRHFEAEPKARKFSFWFGFITVVFWTSSALCPSTESVLKAYALIEGSKVINADNAEKAAVEVGKRFDRFLDIVDKGISGRGAAAPAPQQSPAQ